MQLRWQFFITKLRLSITSLAWLFRRWKYVLLALVITLLFFELVYWLFNLPLISTLLATNSLSFMDKIALLASPFTAVKEASGHLLFSMMILISIIQGIALSALTYAIRNQPRVDAKLLGGSTFVSLLAVIGLGCPACGTSLITPLIATFVSGSAVALSEQITLIAMPLAITIGLYGLYVLGLRIATIKQRITQI